jgi:hypothetical protein
MLLRPLETGTLIKFKPLIAELPIFRIVDNNRNVLIDLPEQQYPSSQRLEGLDLPVVLRRDLPVMPSDVVLPIS